MMCVRISIVVLVRLQGAVLQEGGVEMFPKEKIQISLTDLRNQIDMSDYFICDELKCEAASYVFVIPQFMPTLIADLNKIIAGIDLSLDVPDAQRLSALNVFCARSKQESTIYVSNGGHVYLVCYPFRFTTISQYKKPQPLTLQSTLSVKTIANNSNNKNNNSNNIINNNKTNDPDISLRTTETYSAADRALFKKEAVLYLESKKWSHLYSIVDEPDYIKVAG